MMLMAKSKIRLSNTSVFTSLRKLLHQAERECYELVNCPFLSEDEKAVAINVYQQLLFCLELSKDKLL